jgi:hypothetical protein
MDIKEYSIEALEAEIEIRKKKEVLSKKIKMVPFSQRDYKGLEDMAKEYVDDFIENDVGENVTQYFFEEVIEVFYGTGIWAKLETFWG